MRMRVGAVLGCLVLAVSATPALAKKKKKAVLQGPVVTASATGNTASATGEVSTAVASCPKGKVALGGGFSAPWDPASALGVFESYRSGTRSWTVSAFRSAGSGAASAFVYCRKATKAVTDASASATVPSGSGETAGASATCPSGSRLISGGFQSSRGPDTVALAFALVNMSTGPGTWSISDVNNSVGAQTITAHAYCLAGIKSPRILNATNSPTLAQGVIGSTNSPSCPAPKRKGKKKKKPAKLLSGGGYAGPLPPAAPAGIATESHTAGRSWLTSTANITGPNAPLAITSQAICVG